MLLPPFVSLLLWNLLLAGDPVHGQGTRGLIQAGMPFSDIIWFSTDPGVPSPTAIVNSTVSNTTSTIVSQRASNTSSVSVFANATSTGPTSIPFTSKFSTPSASSSTTGFSSHGSHLPTTANGQLTASTTSSTGASNAALVTPTDIEKRAAIPQCLKTVELSCLNLAAACLSSVNFDNRNNIWSIRPCVAAATCYHVGDLLTSIKCQTGFDLTNPNEAALDHSIFDKAVGSCAPNACPMTRQNYMDFYYGSLTLIHTANWPSSTDVVIGFWNPILTWAATGTTIPYKNFNDWLHFSTFPTSITTITHPAAPTYTVAPWNPNPAPPPGAASETFVRSSTTLVIAVPKSTTTKVTVAGATITVGPGGTPVGGLLPTDVKMPDAVLPTWNSNPIPPPDAKSVTFVFGTWTSIVPAPTASGQSVRVNGPPDDGDDDDDDNSWLIIFGLLGPVIIGSLPAAVITVGAKIPVPGPPPDWPDDDGDWTPPPNAGGSDPDDPDDGEDDDPDDPETCTFLQLPPYDLPYDGAGEDDDSFIHRSIDYGNYSDASRSSLHLLFKRTTREIALGPCIDPSTGKSYKFTFSGIRLDTTTWYTIDPPNLPAVASSATTLYSTQNGKRRADNVAEHLFEFQYISDFVQDHFTSRDCQWLLDNFWNAKILDGTPVTTALKQAIDDTANLVWAATVLNRAKSYIANDDKPNPNDPPLRDVIDSIRSLDPNVSNTQALKIETLIRAFGALGQYFDDNDTLFKGTAQRVQDVLARITPKTSIYPPLDTMFNNWLRTLMNSYSQRIRSRGLNTYNYYVNHLNGLLAQAQATNPPGNPPPVVPACWPVYHDPSIVARLSASGINAANFIPSPIPHSACNAAGQLGGFILWMADANTPVFFPGNPDFQIVALGSRFFGLTTPSQNSMSYDVDLASMYGNQCTGIRWVVGRPIGTVAPNLRIATWDQDCIDFDANGNQALSNLFLTDSNGNRLQCFFNNYNDGSNGFAIDCGRSQVAVQTCITHMNQIDGRPNAITTIPFFRFIA